MSAKYFTLSQKLNSVRKVAEIGNKDVVKTGIASLDDIIGLKKGYPVFIGGAPHAGKTEVGLEVLINLSIEKGYKWFCYLGEGGTTENIFLELLHKFLGKPYLYAEGKEKVNAEYFIETHFVIANEDLDFMITGFYDAVLEAEKELDIKFDGTFFDPFNDIEEELQKFNGREDKFLAYALKEVRKSSKKHNRVDFVVTHVADIRAVTDKEGNRYMPAALPNEWSGGRTWWRRAFMMILVYRPPSFLKDENGRNYEENETLIYCQKAKPKGIGKLGKRSIFWDWKKNRYYSYLNGQMLYSCEKIENFLPTPKMKPNLDFSAPITNNNEDPF
jgi:hypothetical protein